MGEPAFFSSDAFLGAVARSHFPGRTWRIENVEVEGRPFLVLSVGRRVIDELWTHPFFYEALPPGTPFARQHPTLAKVAQGVIRVPAETPAPPMVVAPFIAWRGFSSFDEYRESRRAGPGTAPWTSVARHQRWLARDVGEVEFVPDDARPDALPALFVWKSRQFRRTGRPDPFSVSASLKLYRTLRDEGVLRVSTIRAGGSVVAGHAGYRWAGRFYQRLFTYDPKFARYSPGAVLQHAMLRESFEAGDEHFDFLQGGEQYKWLYATHARVIGPLGVRPRYQRLERRVRDAVGTPLLRLRQRRRSPESATHG